MVIVLACGAVTGTYASQVQADLPTPWVGVGSASASPRSWRGSRCWRPLLLRDRTAARITRRTRVKDTTMNEAKIARITGRVWGSALRPP
jgi:hypothetical protein